MVFLGELLGCGIGLTTEVVASTTAADQLRTRLGERTSRIADLGARIQYEKFPKPSDSDKHKVWVLV